MSPAISPRPSPSISATVSFCRPWTIWESVCRFGTSWSRFERRSELRFCFIDAAQAFCHVPLDDCLTVADFIVAGSHKWMGAYLPTGIGLFGQRRSREMIEHRVRPSRKDSLPDDPLLHFTEQLDAGQLDGHSETANLTSLFACAGAVADNLSPLAQAAADSRILLGYAAGTAWRLGVGPTRAGNAIANRVAQTRSNALSPSESGLASARLVAGRIRRFGVWGWHRSPVISPRPVQKRHLYVT